MSLSNQIAHPDLTTLQEKEWIVTNGIGGYASSTVVGMNTRRYHGLLVAATTPPVGRLMMLSKTEDVLTIDGERIELSTNLYGGGIFHPTGFQHLESFFVDPFPTFTYSGPRFKLTKSIFLVRNENTVVVEYTFTPRGDVGEVLLEVRPLIGFRDFHTTTHENGELDGSIRETHGCVVIKPYADLPSLFLAHDADTVGRDGYWYRNFEYAEEKARGLDHVEDLYSPLVFKTSFHERKRFVLIASTERRNASDGEDYRRAEIRRQGIAYYQHHAKYGSSQLIPILMRAAEQFIVARPPFKTVIAGYHWFGDWGRDTMIALPGLLLSTDQPETAKEILLQFLRFVDGGMLPNRFPDRGETPEYNTVDATLWFFEAIWQYLAYSADPTWREAALQLIETTFYPALKDIARFHISGTRYGIHVDQDGFLWAGDQTTQLTWMDAKVGDTAITPRAGRPVEIQALWYNALRILEEFGRLFADNVAADYYAGIANRLEEKFETVFWNREAQCLFDVVGDGGSDPAVRPNQVIAVSLRHYLLNKERALDVLRVAERDLLTPFGLRTLSPSHPQYRNTYEGGVWSRDSAYHQGTVWPWLAGPFFSAKLRFAHDPHIALDEANAWLENFGSHFREAGLGQVSEIFDGDLPHHPRGCIAQAWSVSELLKLAKTVYKLRQLKPCGAAASKAANPVTTTTVG